jgi:hypothetical protein
MLNSIDFNQLTKQTEKQQAHNGSTLVFNNKVIDWISHFLAVGIKLALNWNSGEF